MVFTTGGSLQTATETLTEQAQKALFTFRKYLRRFANISPDHVLELFDKLIKPILLYGSEIWGVVKRPSIECVHTLFMKSCLGVKVSTQNDFVYCELGRLDMYSYAIINVIKYWVKVINSNKNKYINIMYKQMLHDIARYPNKQN